MTALHAMQNAGALAPEPWLLPGKFLQPGCEGQAARGPRPQTAPQLLSTRAEPEPTAWHEPA